MLTRTSRLAHVAANLKLPRRKKFENRDQKTRGADPRKMHGYIFFFLTRRRRHRRRVIFSGHGPPDQIPPELRQTAGAGCWAVPVAIDASWELLVTNA
jgi:hypothetical protein